MTRTRRRPTGWADDRIPKGFVSKRAAARLLKVSTVTIDRWSRAYSPNGGWHHLPILTRYTHPGYPYTLFDLDEVTKLNGETAA
jgi:hypothetical protein